MKREPFAHWTQDLNYTLLKVKNPPEPVRGLPKGVWIPISVAAYLMGCSQQTVRLMQLTRQIRSIKFPVGPILVDISRYMVDTTRPEIDWTNVTKVEK
jgi:hypothetical protein